MDFKKYLLFIIPVIVILVVMYAGLGLCRKIFLREVHAEILLKETKLHFSLPNSYRARREWNQKAENISRDHKNLTESYKQRERDHKRLINIVRSK